MNHIFISAARPAVIWVGVITLFYAGIGISLLNWISGIYGFKQLPPIDPVLLDNILWSILGLGAARTVEKVKGVNTDRIKNE